MNLSKKNNKIHQYEKIRFNNLKIVLLGNILI